MNLAASTCKPSSNALQCLLGAGVVAGVISALVKSGDFAAPQVAQCDAAAHWLAGKNGL